MLSMSSEDARLLEHYLARGHEPWNVSLEAAWLDFELRRHVSERLVRKLAEHDRKAPRSTAEGSAKVDRKAWLAGPRSTAEGSAKVDRKAWLAGPRSTAEG